CHPGPLPLDVTPAQAGAHRPCPNSGDVARFALSVAVVISGGSRPRRGSWREPWAPAFAGVTCGGGRGPWPPLLPPPHVTFAPRHRTSPSPLAIGCHLRPLATGCHPRASGGPSSVLHPGDVAGFAAGPSPL